MKCTYNAAGVRNPVSHVSPVRVVVGAAAVKVTLYQVPGRGHTLKVFLTWSKKENTFIIQPIKVR
jgi:hypothetical protein